MRGFLFFQFFQTPVREIPMRCASKKIVPRREYENKIGMRSSPIPGSFGGVLAVGRRIVRCNG
jgi:hypothetical protein